MQSETEKNLLIIETFALLFKVHFIVFIVFSVKKRLIKSTFKF